MAKIISKLQVTIPKHLAEQYGIAPGDVVEFVASLIDTTILVYRFDPRDPAKQHVAEVYGIAEILSEDFEHGRRYGAVRIVDPFLTAADGVHELPPLYAAE